MRRIDVDIGGRDVLAARDVVDGEIRVLREPRLDVMRPGQDTEQGGIRRALVAGILDDHAHLAAGPLEAGSNLQRYDIFGIGIACCGSIRWPSVLPMKHADQPLAVDLDLD